MNDTSEILPINREELDNDNDGGKEIQSQGVVEPLQENKGLDTIKEEEEDETDDEEEVIAKKPKKEIFELPKIEISKKTGKPKRKLTEKQLENLAKARAKSKTKRAALKEANDMEKATKKEMRKKEREARIIKKEEQEALISMKAKLQDEANRNSTWDEERLQGLINKSIDNYIEKKKRAKPVPKVHIPAQTAYPQLPPQAQPQSSYYNAPSAQPQFYQKPIPQYRKAPPQSQYNPMETLFGTFNTD